MTTKEAPKDEAAQKPATDKKQTRRFPILRIALIPILIAALALSNPQHFDGRIIEKSYVSFFLLALLLADLASLLAGRWRDILLVATSLALGFAIADAVAEHISPPPLLYAAENFSGRLPIVGWGPQRPGNFTAKSLDPRTGAIVYDVNYTIDQRLLRRTLSCDKGPTVAFFGCSETFGFGVNDADTFPQIFSDDFDRRLRVLNLSFPAYGPQQFLRELETGYYDKIVGEHPKLFVFLTGSFHAERTACKASWWRMGGPRYALENGHVVFAGSCGDGRLRAWINHTAIYRVFVEPYREQLTHDDIELYIRVVLAAVHLAKEKYGVPTVIPYVGWRNPHTLSGTGFTDDEIIQRLQNGGAHVVNISLVKDKALGTPLAIPGDGHATPLGNRLRALILKNYIEHDLPEIGLATSAQCN